MSDFQAIFDAAAARHGEDNLRARLDEVAPKTPAELAAIPDDRWLSTATRCIFQAGFNWKVIEAKWDGFEAAFEGFDLGRWVLSSDDDLAALVADTRVVRNPQKLKTVPDNARFFAHMSREHGGVGKWIGGWPVTDQIGLMEALDKGGSRLGAMTGQYFLRFMGKDSFILSRDVTAALKGAGVIDGPTGSKKARTAIQAAFNDWAEQSGLSMTALSRTLAMSIDG